MNRDDFLEQYSGQIFKTAELCDLLGSRTAISRFKTAGVLEMICHGFYAVGSDYDPVNVGYEVLSKYYGENYVVSGMSALFLHGLSELMPDYIEVDFERGSEGSYESELYVSKKVSSSRMIGIEKMDINGRSISLYSPERTLIDIIKGKSGVGNEFFNKAIGLYRSQFGFHVEKFHPFKEVFPNEVKKIISSIQLLETVDSPY